MTVARRKGEYRAELVGVPGRFERMRVANDSVYVDWDLGGAVLALALHGVGETLEGAWNIGANSGAIIGKRRGFSASRALLSVVPNDADRSEPDRE